MADVVDRREYELGAARISYRYMTNAVGWLLHDTIVHPLTGIIGFAGRLCWSMRLMALSHHLHNVTAPNDDTLADYVEALQRAGCNEGGWRLSGEVAEEGRMVNCQHRFAYLRAEGRWDTFFCEACTAYRWVDPLTNEREYTRPRDLAGAQTRASAPREIVDL